MKSLKIFTKVAVALALIISSGLSFKNSRIYAEEGFNIGYTDTYRLDNDSKAYIEFVTNEGIMQGYTDNGFKPNINLSRRHAAIILVRALNLETKAFEGIFPDVSDKENYGGIEIEALERAGIISGYPNGNFKPEAPLQRVHLAKMIVNAYKLEMQDKEITQKDLEFLGPDKKYVDIILSNGIVDGFSSDIFGPRRYVKRVHVAKFLANTIETIEERKNGKYEVLKIEVKDSTTIKVTFKGLNGEENFIEDFKVEDIKNGSNKFTFKYNNHTYTETVDYRKEPEVFEPSKQETEAAALKAATDALATAESSKTNETRIAAQTLVTALPDGAEKTALQGRLDSIVTAEDQADLDAASLLQAATDAASTAESSKTNETRIAAQTLVTALPDGAKKTALQGRLDAIVTTEDKTALVDSKTNAKTALDNHAKVADYLTNAAALTSAISAGKLAIEAATTTEQVEIALANAKATIDLIKTDGQLASVAVSTAESDKTNETKATAQTLVTELPGGAEKTALQGRLDAIVTTEDETALAQAKLAKKAVVDAILTGLTQEKYTVESWKALTDAIAADKVAIDKKTAVSDVEGYDLTAIETKAGLVTKVEKDALEVSNAKTAIEGATYTDLEVADTENQTLKTAAVQAKVDTVKGSVTAVVSWKTETSEYHVKISKGTASVEVAISSATFKLSLDAKATKDAEEFKTTHTTILVKTIETVAIDNKASLNAALSAYNLLSSEAKNKVSEEKALLDNLLIKIDALEAAADLQIAKTAIEGAKYTNLEVTDLNDQTIKTAAVQAKVDTLKGSVTAVVSWKTETSEYHVKISKGTASVEVAITSATFTSSLYVMATDEDFRGEKDGDFYYIGTAEYVEIPHTIKNVPVTSYKKMFSEYSKNETNLLGVKSTNRNVTDMYEMFSFSKATSLNLSIFDTRNVTSMEKMFYESHATSLDLSNFNTSNVTSMHKMFYKSMVESLDLSSFDTSNVTNMSAMFNYSKSTSLGLSSFDTSNVTNMSEMFHTSKATSLDLSSFDTSKVTDTSSMFSGSFATTGYARTEQDANKFNKTYNKPGGLTFVVK